VKKVTFKIIGVSIVLASFLVGWQLFGMQTFLRTPLAVGEQGLTLVVPQGISMKKLAGELHKRKIIAEPRYLVWRARWRGISRQIKSGEYQVPEGMYPDQLLSLLISGKVKQYSLTIVEGWTFQQMLKEVHRHEAIQHTLKNLTPDEIMKKLGKEGEHPEGRFLPDTYQFPRGTTDVQFLKRAYAAMSKVLDQEWQDRSKGLPIKNPYEILILASIIEKETAIKDEYPMVAGVFVRRLQKKMRLQTDPTVIYGMGDRFDGNLRLRDLRKDTPYNTYTRRGLPPTPIALPGRMAIHGALHPDQGNSLYFVAKGDGSHHFSSTLKEHNRAVIRYQLGGKPRAFSSMPATNNKK
jgi:UPF0755 protein